MVVSDSEELSKKEDQQDKLPEEEIVIKHCIFIFNS